jgi:DNA adenine methylase
MALTAFPWFGGKAAPKIHKALLSLMPPHTRYVEAFGGGASLLLNKVPSEVEVYNDVNRGAVNFFRVVSDADLFARFLSRVSMLPVSRELYEEHARTWAGLHEPIEQAVRWYYVARQSFGGMFGKSWGSVVESTNRGMAQTAASWQSALEALPKIHQRMQRVQIECSDWSDVLDRYSGPGWFAYCDPPYVLGARRAGGYEHELRDSDHARMIQTLLHYNGAVMLSGYNSPLYDR